MEMIEVKLDEANELYFNVKVEGTSAAPVSVRLVCESDDFSAVFVGSYTSDGEIKVVIPEMKKNASFKEDKDYSAQLEVMVENRFFVPLKFGLKFKETFKVFAEVAQRTNTIVETAKPAPKQVIETVEVKKTAPSVTANIVVKQSNAVLKETIEQRKKDVFQRLNKVAPKK